MPPDPRPAKRIRDPELLRRYRFDHLNDPCEWCELRTGIDVHHRIFRSRGGDDIESNLIWLCRACHDAVHSSRLDPFDLL